MIDLFEPQWHPDDMKDGKPVAPYDAAGWTLPALPTPSQPNDYGQLLSVVRTRRARSLGENARARLREMLRERYADLAMLTAAVEAHRMSGVFALREIQCAVLLDLY